MSRAYTLKNIEIVTGFNVQARDYNDSKEARQYFELGVAKSIHFYGHHGPSSLGVYISEEVYFDEKNIYGTKIGAYTHYMFDIGFSIIYYTNFQQGNLKLRPELGLGMGAIRIVGGYNMPTFGNKAFQEVRRSDGQLTIQCMIPVKKKRINNQENIIKSILKK